MPVYDIKMAPEGEPTFTHNSPVLGEIERPFRRNLLIRAENEEAAREVAVEQAYSIYQQEKEVLKSLRDQIRAGQLDPSANLPAEPMLYHIIDPVEKVDD